MGENGLVPSRIVVGIIPNFPILSHDLPSQKTRMEILKMAQAEMNSIIAEEPLLAALIKKYQPLIELINWDRKYLCI